MAYTIADIATHKSIDGQLVALTEDEKNSILEEWNSPVIKPYDQRRHAEYPSIGDQLDMLWHAIDVGDWTAAKVKTTSFYTELKAVKDANPKP